VKPAPLQVELDKLENSSGALLAVSEESAAVLSEPSADAPASVGLLCSMHSLLPEPSSLGSSSPRRAYARGKFAVKAIPALPPLTLTLSPEAGGEGIATRTTPCIANDRVIEVYLGR
jgi:hypothetical protein